MSKIVTLALYVTSFIPLWISVLFIDIRGMIKSSKYIYTEKIGIIVILVINIISFVIIYRWLHRKNGEATEELILKSAREEKSISAEYLLSYILPLFAFDFTQWESVILFSIFFITLGFICVKHNNLSVNIILEIMNYSVYSCLFEKEDNQKVQIERKVLSKTNLKTYRGYIIKLNNLNNEYSFAPYICKIDEEV